MSPLLGFQQCIWPVQKDSAMVYQIDLYGLTTQFPSSMEVSQCLQTYMSHVEDALGTKWLTDSVPSYIIQVRGKA